MKRFILILNLFILITACKNKNQEEAAIETNNNTITLTEAQFKNAGITTGKFTQENISTLLKVNGKIDVPPQNMVSISVPLGGYLKHTNLLAGMHVNKGDVLATIDDQQYIQIQQDYLTTKAQFEFTESEYKRQSELNKNKATSDKVFEQVKATYHTQQILIKALEEKLKLIGLNPQKISTATISKNINIYSPISGFVTAVNVNIGKYLNPSDVLFELVDPTDIHLNLAVFEKDVNKLSIGQKLFAYSNNNPDKKYLCDIILISKNLNNENFAEVHCHFEKYSEVLLPGMFMNAEIETKSTLSNALPNEAIVRFENKQYVFIQTNDKTYKMIEVQTGNTENGLTEIIIAEKYIKETFVLKGAYNLLMSLKNIGEEE